MASLAFSARLSSDILELMRVGEGGPNAGAEHGLDADLGAERAAQHVEHAGDEAVDVDSLTARAPGGGRRQAAAGSAAPRCCAPCRAASSGFVKLGAQLGSAPVLARSAKLAPHCVEIAEDDGEQIVEVVRDAAGQLAHGFHLLRLAQRRLRLVAQASIRRPAPRCRSIRPFKALRVETGQDAGQDRSGQERETDQGRRADSAACAASVCRSVSSCCSVFRTRRRCSSRMSLISCRLADVLRMASASSRWPVLCRLDACVL